MASSGLWKGLSPMPRSTTRLSTQTNSYKFIALLLVWAMIITSLPLYSASAPRAKWMNLRDLGVVVSSISTPEQSTSMARPVLAPRAQVARSLQLREPAQGPTARLQLASLTAPKVNPIKGGMLLQAGQSGRSSIPMKKDERRRFRKATCRNKLIFLSHAWISNQD